MPNPDYTSTTGAGSGDDTIHVAQINDSSDENPLEDPQRLEGMDQNPAQSVSMGKGKAPMRPFVAEVDMRDVGVDSEDDNVTEYSFKPEDYPHDSELEDEFDEDARSHISLSDDDHEPEVPPPGNIEWSTLNHEQRLSYERMFGTVQQRPINGSWNLTENYQTEVDEQCLSYLKTYDLKNWLLPPREAEFVLNKLLDRVRLRAIGIKIYGPQLPPSQNAHHQNGPHHHPQPPMPMPNHPVPENHTLRSQPSMQPMPVPPGVNMGQPMRQPMPFAQPHPYQNGAVPVGMHPSQHMRLPAYPPFGPMPPHGMRPNMGSQQGSKASRKSKSSASERGVKGGEPSFMAPPPLKAPTPPYPMRPRPDTRKTVGKAGRGKTRRQAEADEFPWNRQLDFIAARIASKSKDTWDDSVYDANMLAEMARTRVRNQPVVAALETEISIKQKISRKKKFPGKNAPAKVEAESDDEAEREVDAEADVDAEGDGEGEGEDGSRRAKGGRKKSRGAEAGNDPYHSGNFAYAGPEDQQLASSMGYRTVDEVIEAGEADKLSLDELFRIKICWSPGKKGNSQDLEQAKFSARDTVNTRKMLAKTPILTHRAGECIIDFCPDLLWRDILLRVLSEAGFSNKDIRDRFCLNGSFSDRATVAKRLGAALGKDTNPPRGKGKEAAMDWCETNRDDFDNYQAFFGKRPPARRTAQGRKKARLSSTAKGDETEEDRSPSKTPAKDTPFKETPKMALDGAADEESASEDSDGGEGHDEAVSLQDSDDLDAMSD